MRNSDKLGGRKPLLVWVLIIARQEVWIMAVIWTDDPNRGTSAASVQCRGVDRGASNLHGGETDPTIKKGE